MRDEILYVIGVADRQDWEAGRGSLYWIKAPNRRARRVLPVFTDPEQAKRHWEANSSVRDRLDMADSVATTHQGPLLQRRIVVMPLNAKGLAMAAARVKADYLIRDPSSTLTSHSISPTASDLVCAWASKRPQVPSRLQRLKRSKQVCQGPYLSGRSRQGEPVRSFRRASEVGDAQVDVAYVDVRVKLGFVHSVSKMS